MSKKALIVRLVILIITFIVVAALCAFCVGAINGNIFAIKMNNLRGFGINIGRGEPKLVSSDKYDADSFTDIQVNTASYDISVKYGGDQIAVNYYSNSSVDDNNLEIKSETKTLTINSSRNVFFFVINSTRGYIEIEIPESMKYNYTLSTASGDIYMEASAADADISTVSGDIKIPAISADNLKVTTTSGDINCAADTPKAVISTTSGEVESRGNVTDISAKSVSGDLSISLCADTVKCYTKTVSGDADFILDDIRDYSVDFSTVSGDLDDNIDNRESDGDERYTVGEGTVKITAESVSGDIELDR